MLRPSNLVVLWGDRRLSLAGFLHYVGATQEIGTRFLGMYHDDNYHSSSYKYTKHMMTYQPL